MKRPSVLILDDEPAFERMFTVLLQILKWEGEVVTSPREALQSLKKRRFDVLIVDVEGRKADRLAIIQSFREEGILTPVIVMSDDKEVLRQVTGDRHSFVVPLLKPFTVEALNFALVNAASRFGTTASAGKKEKTLPSNPKQRGRANTGSKNRRSGKK